jgi:alpha-L-fucosidase 2
VSHLYGVWPGNEIDPDRTPQLALAAKIANRRRTFDVMATAVAGETLAAYFRCHRALVGARLKDNVIVDTQLRQLIEQGYLSTAFRCSREPRGIPIPDAQAAFPAITMEMLIYSRPGIIEILPALPDSLLKGSISGMLARTFARINRLSWDMDNRTVTVVITSLKDQDVTLVARHGIADIKSPSGVLASSFNKGQANTDLHLKKDVTVELNIKLGDQNPSDWYAL